MGLILEKTPEVISVPRSSKRVELNMGNGNGVLVTNLGVVWKLLRPSSCPHPHASLIEEVTDRVRLAPTEDEYLATFSVAHKLILPQVKESGEKTNKLRSANEMEPGSCLDSTCESGEHTCEGRSCVRIQSFQKEDLVTWFEDITEREKSEVRPAITGEARVGTSFGDCVERGVVAWGVAGDSKTYQELEGRSRGGNGISHGRSLWSAIKCEIPSRVSDGQPVQQPLPTAHGDGGGIQPKGIDRQSLLGAQVRESGSDVAPLAPVVEKDPRNSAERAEIRLE